ncbi:MAG: hypothetical protein LBH04_11850 [Tannerellaceae bacterium]|jgi:hypothetical protein|nr:hypothetical protein [Tannerellaceae bacterium]
MTKRLFSKKQRKLILSILIIPLVSTMASAETRWKITPGADLVSSYVWRGVYQTGASVQPSLTLSHEGGLGLVIWGSTDLATAGQSGLGIAKEFDFTLSYTIGSLGLSLTDYWWAGEGQRYGAYSASHFIEGSIAYSFGQLVLSCNTMLREGDGGDKDYKQLYSTYIQGDYNFNFRNVSCTLSAGLIPLTSIYHRTKTAGLTFSTISLTATKKLRISNTFSLPVFTRAIVAPNQDNVYLVFGINL